MRVQPFSYIKSPTAVGGAPFIEDMVFWLKDIPNTASGSTWVDSLPVGQVTASLQGLNISIEGSSIRLDNSTGTSAFRNSCISIKPSNSSITVQSAIIVFNKSNQTGGAGTDRAYFYDARDANAESPDNGGFFNQYDSTTTNSGKIHGEDATFYAYENSTNNFIDGGTITQTLLTDGTGNSTGGDDYYQWMGPDGRSQNLTKRAFFFNYNTNKPIVITTNNEGWYIGSNDAGNEASSMDLFTIIGYNRHLTYTEFQQLIQYLDDTGVF